MRNAILRLLVSFGAVVSGWHVSLPGQTLVATKPLIKKVDAVHIRVTAEQFEPFFALLFETFRLPASWPAGKYGFLATGGVTVGNADIGLFQPFRELPAFEVSLEPVSFDDVAAQLDAHSIGHGPLITIPIAGYEGIGLTGWREYEIEKGRRVPLLQILTYNREFYERRAEVARKLASDGGGPLGIIGLEEIVIGVRDMPDSLQWWQRLLSPHRMTNEGVWKPGDGAGIRLVAAKEDRFEALVLRVRALAQAWAFLEQRDLLGDVTANWITVNARHTAGATIRLCEAVAQGSPKREQRGCL